METSSNAPQTPKSRGHTLFDRQARLHAHDPNSASNYNSNTILDVPSTLPPLRVYYSNVSPSRSSQTLSSNCHHIDEAKKTKENNKIQRKSSNESFLQTDFPFNDCPTDSNKNLISTKENPTNSFCCALIDSEFDYLNKQKKEHDDDDDVVSSVRNSTIEHFHQVKHDENENLSEDAESVDTIDLDEGLQRERANTGDFLNQPSTFDHVPQSNGDSLNQPSTNNNFHHKNNNLGNQSSTINENHRQNSKEKIFEQNEVSTVPTNDDDESDSENQSHEDEIDDDREKILEKETQMKQLRKQRMLWSIAHEWLRKEEIFLEELEKFNNQLNPISSALTFQNSIQKLIFHHKNVLKQIKVSYDREQQSIKSIKQLTEAVDALMQTIDIYDESIQNNLGLLRKALERRPAVSSISTEDLLSILPKQFLQILSQVQDLYKTVVTLGSEDRESLRRLCDFSHICKLLGSRQDENINKVVLKNEDVAILGSRKNRDRCHLILYPDVIVCCQLRTGLLAGAKYNLLWFIPMIDLQWNIPQTPAGDTSENSNEIKNNLQTAYRELEKSSTNSYGNDLKKNRQIRRQEIEYNLAQSNLQLCLSHLSNSTSRQQYSYVLLFTSAYQRQDWIDLIEKTHKDLVQRSSTFIDPINAHQQRLTESLIQKRLDFVKPPGQGTFLNSENGSPINLSKTYSGTLEFTIHSLKGSGLFTAARNSNSLSCAENFDFQFYVAIEIDNYKTFQPYAQTTRKPIGKDGRVEFRGEIFEIELEHSVAFRMLIYRIEPTSNNNQNRPQCIGKFHRNIEAALKDFSRRSSGCCLIESPNEDLKLEISLKYSEREGTFHRRRSKRNKAIFGKTIEQLMTNQSGLIEGIPRIIYKCAELVERDGLEETGIYRVCCVTSDLQKLRREFDRNQHHAEEILSTRNVHVAANLLKLFLRELHEPLFSSNLYSDSVNAIHLTDVDNQRVALLRTFESLPQDNRRILLFLLNHLLRVSQFSSVNMMHLDNLAVVFGPTLMRPSKPVHTSYFSSLGQHFAGSNIDLSNDADHMSSELQGSMDQCRVVLAYLKLRRDGLLK